jgi:ATP-dependent RNA helicase DBP3
MSSLQNLSIHYTDSAEPSQPVDPSAEDKKEKKKRKKEKKAAEQSAASSSSSTPKPSAPPATDEECAEYLSKNSITITVSAGQSGFKPCLSFASLPVSPELAKSFAKFKEPTPIQACTWPPALEGKDVVGIAETGRYIIYTFGPDYKLTFKPVAKRSLLAFQHFNVSSPKSLRRSPPL